MLSNGIDPFAFFVFAGRKGRKRNNQVGTRNGMADRSLKMHGITACRKNASLERCIAQGLKPCPHFCFNCGLAEAIPLLQSSGFNEFSCATKGESHTFGSPPQIIENIRFLLKASRYSASAKTSQSDRRYRASHPQIRTCRRRSLRALHVEKL